MERNPVHPAVTVRRIVEVPPFIRTAGMEKSLIKVMSSLVDPQIQTISLLISMIQIAVRFYFRHNNHKS